MASQTFLAGPAQIYPAARLLTQPAYETLPYPGRFKPAASLGRLAHPLQSLFPKEIQGMPTIS